MQLNPSKPAFNYKIQTGLFCMKHKEDIRTKWDVIMGSTLTKSKACTNFYTVITVFLAVKSCLTLCDPVDCSPPGSSLHGILQARILEWVAISSCRASSPPRDGTLVLLSQVRSSPLGHLGSLWSFNMLHRFWNQKEKLYFSNKAGFKLCYFIENIYVLIIILFTCISLPTSSAVQLSC